MNPDQIVVVVDDDPGIRDSLGMLLESVGLPSRIYSNGHTFLEEAKDIPGGCVVLDIRMPGMSGMELLEELRRKEVTLPIIFITGHGDIAMAVKAMRMGALDFITKPFREQDLLDRVHEGLECDADRREWIHDHVDLTRRIKLLTNREQQVFKRVANGNANKVIAHELGVSERTVEVHRAQVMRKLGARSVADVVRMRIESQRPIYEPLAS